MTSNDILRGHHQRSLTLQQMGATGRCYTHTHRPWSTALNGMFPLKPTPQCSGNPEEETAQRGLELKGTWWTRSSKLTEQSSHKLRKTEAWGVHGPLVYITAFSWGFYGTSESVKEWGLRFLWLRLGLVSFCCFALSNFGGFCFVLLYFILLCLAIIS